MIYLCQVTDGLLVQYADDTTLICSGAIPSLAAIFHEYAVTTVDY